VRSRGIPGRDRWLGALFLLYTVASLLHFIHNAEYVDSYPNLPAWISRASVYAVWLAVAGAGLLGLLLCRSGRYAFGLPLLVLYALAGLDGLLHYTRAAPSAHSAAMNFTILFEAVVAAALLVAVYDAARRRFRRPAR